MRKPRDRATEICELLRRTPSPDVIRLQENLRMLEELRKRGVKIGPNYNLESPFCRRQQHGHKSQRLGSELRLKENPQKNHEST